MSSTTTAGAARAAACYKGTGIFFCANYLRERGVESPARVVLLVGLSLRDAAQALEATQAHASSLDACMAASLDSALRRYGAGAKERLDDVTAAVNQVVAWDAYADFAELLNAQCGPAAYEYARRRLARNGITAPLDVLSDVAVGFVERTLPRAVRAFDPIRGEGRESAWLTTVFYR